MVISFDCRMVATEWIRGIFETSLSFFLSHPLSHSLSLSWLELCYCWLPLEARNDQHPNTSYPCGQSANPPSVREVLYGRVIVVRLDGSWIPCLVCVYLHKNRMECGDGWYWTHSAASAVQCRSVVSAPRRRGCRPIVASSANSDTRFDFAAKRLAPMIDVWAHRPVSVSVEVASKQHGGNVRIQEWRMKRYGTVWYDEPHEVHDPQLRIKSEPRSCPSPGAGKKNVQENSLVCQIRRFSTGCCVDYSRI